MDKLEEIKSRLERVSPLPWEVDIGNEAYGVMTPEGSLTWDDHGGEVFAFSDAEFIANAPEDIQKLIETLEAVRNFRKYTRQELYEMSLGDMMYAEGYNYAVDAVRAAIDEMIDKQED